MYPHQIAANTRADEVRTLIDAHVDMFSLCQFRTPFILFLWINAGYSELFWYARSECICFSRNIFREDRGT